VRAVLFARTRTELANAGRGSLAQRHRRTRFEAYWLAENCAKLTGWLGTTKRREGGGKPGMLLTAARSRVSDKLALLRFSQTEIEERVRQIESVSGRPGRGKGEGRVAFAPNNRAAGPEVARALRAQQLESTVAPVATPRHTRREWFTAKQQSIATRTIQADQGRFYVGAGSA
jgi:hypothetical protein